MIINAPEAAKILREAADQASTKLGLRYLSHSIVLDPKTSTGIRYEVHCRNMANGQRSKFNLPANVTEELTLKIAHMFESDSESKLPESGQVKKTASH